MHESQHRRIRHSHAQTRVYRRGHKHMSTGRKVKLRGCCGSKMQVWDKRHNHNKWPSIITDVEDNMLNVGESLRGRKGGSAVVCFPQQQEKEKRKYQLGCWDCAHAIPRLFHADLCSGGLWSFTAKLKAWNFHPYCYNLQFETNSCLQICTVKPRTMWISGMVLPEVMQEDTDVPGLTWL